MFCKIRKGKGGYTIYACDRKRVNGKVVSNDIKLSSFGWHSLYEIDEEHDGLIEDIPSSLIKILKMYLRGYDIKLVDVVEKLIKLKKEYYTTYKEDAIRCELIFEEEKKAKELKQLKEYEEFKEKFKTLHYNELMEKYREGYERGIFEGYSTSKNVKGSNNSIDGLSEEENRILKEAFKLLAMKYHPDKGGDTEKMAVINTLKEKIL